MQKSEDGSYPNLGYNLQDNVYRFPAVEQGYWLSRTILEDIVSGVGWTAQQHVHQDDDQITKYNKLTPLEKVFASEVMASLGIEEENVAHSLVGYLAFNIKLTAYQNAIESGQIDRFKAAFEASDSEVERLTGLLFDYKGWSESKHSLTNVFLSSIKEDTVYNVEGVRANSLLDFWRYINSGELLSNIAGHPDILLDGIADEHKKESTIQESQSNRKLDNQLFVERNGSLVLAYERFAPAYLDGKNKTSLLIPTRGLNGILEEHPELDTPVYIQAYLRQITQKNLV